MPASELQSQQGRRKRNRRYGVVLMGVVGPSSSGSLRTLRRLVVGCQVVVTTVLVRTNLDRCEGFLPVVTARRLQKHRCWNHNVNQFTTPCVSFAGCQHLQCRLLTSRLSSTASTTGANDKDMPAEEQEGVEVEEEEIWRTGNVRDDFDKLERAIALSMAEQNLQHQERLDLLDNFARQRRPLRGDVRDHVLLPLLCSFVLTAIIKTAAGVARPAGKSLVRLATSACDLHFWTVYVVSPALFRALLAVRERVHLSSSSTSLSQVPSSKAPSLGLTYHPTEASSWDLAAYLLEQWCSASLGIIVALPFARCSPWIMPALMLITKLALFASLRQFPSIHYDVFRPNQPRPVAWPVWGMQRMVGSLWLPWCAIPDTIRLTVPWSWPRMVLFYVLAGSTVGGVAYAAPQRLSGSPPQSLIPHPKLFVAGLSLMWLQQNSNFLQMVLATVSPRLRRDGLAVDGPAVWETLRAVVRPLAILMAMAGPAVHLTAFRRLIRVSHGDEVSLADLQDNGSRMRTAYRHDDSKKIWRWRTQWREPRRVGGVLEQWRADFLYWFMLSGSVQDKLRRELDHKSRRPGQSLAHEQGLAILQRIARERSHLRPDTPAPDRTQWKQAAMDRLSCMHQKNYDQNTLHDPLGIAVYKSLGIGLGFNFDHMSNIPDGSRPSTRRLQARAAKSAIRRVQQLYDPERTRLELEAIADPDERKRRAVELRHEAEEEVRYMADRLSALIPLDMALDNPQDTRVDQYSTRFHLRDSSQAIERLLEKYGGVISSNRVYQDSEFLHAWEETRYGQRDKGREGNSTLVTVLA